MVKMQECCLYSAVTHHDNKISHWVVKANPECMLSKDPLSVAFNSWEDEEEKM